MHAVIIHVNDDGVAQAPVMTPRAAAITVTSDKREVFATGDLHNGKSHVVVNLDQALYVFVDLND